MKNIVLILSFAAIVALGVVGLHQQKQVRQTQAELASAQSQLASTQKQLAEEKDLAEKAAFEENKAKILQQTLTQAAEAAAEKTKQAAELEQSLAAAKTNSGGFGSLFNDPKMKELIRSQQKAFMGPMIEKQYAALIQQLNLNPEQTAQFKALLEKKMLAAADMGTSMLGNDMDAAKRADLAKQMKAQTDDFDQQIKQLLGDVNYDSYKTYEKSLTERFTLSQFHDQVAGTDTALNPDQEQQLLQAMVDERNSFKWTTDYSQANSGNVNYADIFSEDRLNQFAKEKAQLDQQILDRAKSILTPEQLAAFEKYQNAQRDLQINSMKLAGKMFAPQSPKPQAN
jgi:hypothetical protein